MNTNDHFRAIIFDLDGTLFDTLPSLVAAAHRVLAPAGTDRAPIAPLRVALSEGLMPMFRAAVTLLSRPRDATDAAALADTCMRHYLDAELRSATLYAGVPDMLDALRARGVRLAVCTNRDRESSEVLLAEAGIAAYFECLVGLGDAPRPKPAADPLLHALHLLNLPAGAVLFVGDSGMDATCARLSQVRFAAHRDGYAAQPTDLAPHVMAFDRYPQFTDWVLGFTPPASVNSSFCELPVTPETPHA